MRMVWVPPRWLPQSLFFQKEITLEIQENVFYFLILLLYSNRKKILFLDLKRIYIFVSPKFKE